MDPGNAFMIGLGLGLGGLCGAIPLALLYFGCKIFYAHLTAEPTNGD